MTTHITDRKGNKLQLNGDILTGDTFAIKDYIKKNMDGKWIADRKAWKVNVEKVNRLIETHAGIRIDDEPVAARHSGQSDAIFPKNMSYDELRRRLNSDDPNSDL